MFINSQTISFFFNTTLVQQHSLWSMITGWMAGWMHTKDRFCAYPGGAIMYFNAQQRLGWALSILVLWEGWGVGLPPSCPITLCQKGCGHANLFPSGPQRECLVIKTLSAPPSVGTTVCRQSLPREVGPADIFDRVIIPLSAVWAPPGLKAIADTAGTAVGYDVTYDIIRVKVVLRLQMETGWLAPSVCFLLYQCKLWNGPTWS